MAKSPDAFRTISEVAEWLDVPTHVLRFWESRFTQVKPVKRAGGRRYYRPTDMALLGGIKRLLHDDGLTIRGAQKLLREEGVKYVASLSPGLGESGAPRASGGVTDPLGAKNDDPDAVLSRWPFADDTPVAPKPEVTVPEPGGSAANAVEDMQPKHVDPAEGTMHPEPDAEVTQPEAAGDDGFSVPDGDAEAAPEEHSDATMPIETEELAQTDAEPEYLDAPAPDEDQLAQEPIEIVEPSASESVAEPAVDAPSAPELAGMDPVDQSAPAEPVLSQPFTHVSAPFAETPFVDERAIHIAGPLPVTGLSRMTHRAVLRHVDTLEQALDRGRDLARSMDRVDG